jgi:hypothetical protein
MLACSRMHSAYMRQSAYKTLRAAVENSLFISPTDLILAEGNSSSLSMSQGATFITGPYLDGNGISNVTTQISTHAYLPCKVSYPTDEVCFNCFPFNAPNPINFDYFQAGPLIEIFSQSIIIGTCYRNTKQPLLEKSCILSRLGFVPDGNFL